jgi:hypothetical protein
MEKIPASKNQRLFIANLIYRRKDDNEYLKKIWLDTPRNNDQHPDLRCDYTQIILAERLSRLTSKQADYIINAFQSTPRYHSLTARNIIIQTIVD